MRIIIFHERITRKSSYPKPKISVLLVMEVEMVNEGVSFWVSEFHQCDTLNYRSFPKKVFDIYFSEFCDRSIIKFLDFRRKCIKRLKSIYCQLRVWKNAFKWFAKWIEFSKFFKNVNFSTYFFPSKRNTLNTLLFIIFLSSI